MAWLLLPAAGGAALAYSRGGARSDAESREEALAVLRERPADARAWIRLARRTDGDAGSMYAVAASLDRGDPAVQRAAALGLARAGDATRAAEVLRDTVDLLRDSGVQWRARSSELALDLASQLLFSDPDSAAKMLESADDGPRKSLVAADILAARANDAAGAVALYLGAATEASKANAGGVADLARLRAMLLTVNATATLPPVEARAWFDRLAFADDPGRVLADLSVLAAAGSLDAKRIWGGDLRLTADAFDAGEVRLIAGATPAGTVAHEIDGGSERLELAYPSETVLNDVWLAKLPMQTSEPRLALSARVRSPGRVGDQLCVQLAGGKRIYGTAGEPDAQGWRRMVVRGFAAKPVAIDGWCFDTRGRPGPFFLDDVELFLDASP